MRGARNGSRARRTERVCDRGKQPDGSTNSKPTRLPGTPSRNVHRRTLANKRLHTICIPRRRLREGLAGRTIRLGRKRQSHGLLSDRVGVRGPRVSSRNLYARRRSLSAILMPSRRACSATCCFRLLIGRTRARALPRSRSREWRPLAAFGVDRSEHEELRCDRARSAADAFSIVPVRCRGGPTPSVRGGRVVGWPAA
jgi:hypothetical protein